MEYKVQIDSRKKCPLMFKCFKCLKIPTTTIGKDIRAHLDQLHITRHYYDLHEHRSVFRILYSIQYRSSTEPSLRGIIVYLMAHVYINQIHRLQDHSNMNKNYIWCEFEYAYECRVCIRYLHVYLDWSGTGSIWCQV